MQSKRLGADMQRATLALAAAVELLGGSRVLVAQTNPAPPRQVWAAQIGPKDLVLVWKRASRAEGYRVYPVGSTPTRGVSKGILARTVDHLSISLAAPFAPSY